MGQREHNKLSIVMLLFSKAVFKKMELKRVSKIDKYHVSVACKKLKKTQADVGRNPNFK